MITSNSDKGREIVEYLQRELGIPKYARRFSVHFAVDDLITVDCEYYPEGPAEEPDRSVEPPEFDETSEHG